MPSNKHSSPLDASLGYRPSFTWRSIISSRDLIKSGVRFRIGSGETVKIWGDPWIPRPSTFRPVTAAPNGLQHAVVAALVDPLTKDWDVELLNGIFTPEDKEEITKIPLGREHQPDSICWHYTRTGMFSVRSAYYLACQYLNPQSTSQTSQPSSIYRWKRIWNSNVPPKIRLFAWKIALDVLPTGQNLEKRIKGTTFDCPFCSEMHEDVLHTFVQCHYARQVWALSDLPWNIISAWEGEPNSWIIKISELLRPEDFEKFLIVSWFLWWNRNKLWMDNTLSSLLQNVSAALSYLATYKAASFLRSPLTRSPRQMITKWNPPPPGTIKINFDGANFKQGRETGIGAVARDSRGFVVAWFSHRFVHQVEAEVCEALATRKAADLAVLNNWNNIILEDDCLSLINKLKSTIADCSNTGPLTFDIKATLRSCNSYSFSHVSRDSNVLAHKLAKCAEHLYVGSSCFSPAEADRFGLVNADFCY
ncbi:UNVERIFIED_CONTAM: hypothetical protein Sradi_1768400 [Sesamum radiatum]|uniref:Uncharacterized protein n=1 Tax=Sesamum radiatum TaxID=300843 RepID=A0AAW2TTN4_SESRA